MAANLIVDTGPLVALLDRSERNHERCVEVVRGWRGQLVTTEAALTEALHLLHSVWQAQHNCLQMFTREAIVLVPSTPDTLKRVATLMEKYRDIPMDYADATLVALSEDLDTDLIFTLDLRGFRTYRKNARTAMKIVPE
jgi:hypothetical protein